MPQSDVPGEHTSPTQPFPTKPAPFARQTFSEADINPYLPDAEKEVLRQKLRYGRNEGLFTPPSFQGSIGMPGHNGGANWGGAAVDPVNGELYIVSKNLPVMLRVEGPTTEEPSARTVNGPVVTPEQAAQALAAAKAAAAQGPVRYAVPYDFLRSPTNGMGAMGPPWSEITAYDLNTGEIKWRKPHGGVLGIGADVGAHFPRGAPLVTAGGLVFAATAQDRQLRAYDRDSGDVLWSYTLPGGSEGIPATYELEAAASTSPCPSRPAPACSRRCSTRRRLRRRSNARTSCSRCRAAEPRRAVAKRGRIYFRNTKINPSPRSGDGVEELLLTPPQRRVGQPAERRAEVVVDVLDLARARDRDRHARVRDDVLQEELTPRRRVELGREIRQLAAFDDVEDRVAPAAERHVDHDGDTAVDGRR